MPQDPAATVRALRACRTAMLEVCNRVKPFGATYTLASAVIAAIDAFADALTGERDYFHAEGSTATEARRAVLAERAARERGDKPW